MKMPDFSYRATVTRVVAGEGVYVMVPKLGKGVEYGPCEHMRTLTGTPLGNYADRSLITPGVRVLVTTVNGVPEDLVVLGVIG